MLGAVAAGSGGVTSKFVAHAALSLFSINYAQTTLGTSTYTVGGTATTSSQQLYLITVQNTSTTTTAALSTATYGPFYAGGQTTTGVVNVAGQTVLNTTTGTAGQGGVPINAGSIVWAVSGTDATAISIVSVDYQIQSQAPITI